MSYKVQLVNGENIIRPFDVEFDNPFKAGSAAQLTLRANDLGVVTVNTATSVKIEDLNNETILSWINNHLALSSVATDKYKLNASMVSVLYDFDETETSYKNIKQQLTPDSKFEVDKNTGVVTFYNGGSSLVPTYTVHVVATVTFRDLSVIEVRIPVLIKGEK